MTSLQALATGLLTAHFLIWAALLTRWENQLNAELDGLSEEERWTVWFPKAVASPIPTIWVLLVAFTLVALLVIFAR